MARHVLLLTALALLAANTSSVAGDETAQADSCPQGVESEDCVNEPDEIAALQASKRVAAEVRRARQAGAGSGGPAPVSNEQKAPAVLEEQETESEAWWFTAAKKAYDDPEASEKVHPEEDTGLTSDEEEFENFLKNNKRSYHKGHKQEYSKRLRHFKQRRKRILERNEFERIHNKNPDRARHGFTKYADWSDDEFKALLGLKKPQGKDAQHVLDATQIEADADLGMPPCTQSWAHRTQVRDQGSCGSCWAFSTAEVMRAAYIRDHGEDPGKLSTQFLVDCMMQETCQGGVNGCCGGLPYSALRWIQQQGGIPTQKAYGDVYWDLQLAQSEKNRTSLVQGKAETEQGPVSPGNGITYSGNHPLTPFPCKKGIPKSVQMDGYPQRQGTEKDMANFMCKTGTMSIAVDASQWDTYVGGVMLPTDCGRDVDHAVIAVGLNASANAWIVQNSWGEDWGVTLEGEAVKRNKYSNCDSSAGFGNWRCHLPWFSDNCPLTCGSEGPSKGGYIYLHYGANTCGLTSMAYAPSSTKKATVSI